MKKHYLLVGLALFVVSAFLFFDRYTRRFLQETSETLDLIRDVERIELQVNSEVLLSVDLIYYSYDNIHKLLKEEEEIITRLIDKNLKNYPESRKVALEFERLLIRKKQAIEDFETLNSIIKNSLTYIPSLFLRYTETARNIDLEYLSTLHNISSYVLLVRKSLDPTFIEDIERYIGKLQSFKVDQSVKPIHDTLMKHLEIFVEFFPPFRRTFLYITRESGTLEKLSQLEDTYVKERSKEANLITAMSFGLTAVFLSVLGGMMYLLLRIETQRRHLEDLYTKLETLYRTDDLTKLPNRKALYEALERSSKPALVLFNIDGFKRFNDLYGVSFGDELLKALANFLREKVSAYKLKCHLFRVGADDFGMLIEEYPNPSAVIDIAQEIVEDAERYTFNVMGLSVNVSLSAGISFEKPFLEKADIALKKVKKLREKVFVFSQELMEELQKNLYIADRVRKAVIEEDIVLHFQPVVKISTGEVLYYECLLRIKDEKGKLIYPSEFLEVAKESKHYRSLTKLVISKAFEIFSSKRESFSVNISLEDITDVTVENFIYDLLEKQPDVARRIIFELLETESVRQYTEVRRFVDIVKSLGAKVAIDDFGAGYSNFSRIANLSPDFIKIDGTLIEALEKNAIDRVVVKHIVEFCKELGIEPIAEFVSKETILKEVKKVGIDLVQGFYVCPPLEKPDFILLRENQG